MWLSVLYRQACPSTAIGLALVWSCVRRARIIWRAL